MEDTNFKTHDLSVEDIRLNLDSTEFSDIFVLETVNSTNSYAKDLAINGAKHGTVVIANHQASGRGRLGRDFFSPKDSGIYMSLLIRPDKICIAPSLLTVAAGIAACRAITSLTNRTPKIKWVNDIFLNGKKVCGILAEGGTKTDSSTLDYVIVGIGLNVSSSPEVFPGKLKDIAGSLFPKNITRSKIAAEIINSFGKLIQAENSEDLIEKYKSYSMILGKKISFTKNGETFTGTATDINIEGNLIVKLENGETVSLKSGEVSLGSENFTN